MTMPWPSHGDRTDLVDHLAGETRQWWRGRPGRGRGRGNGRGRGHGRGHGHDRDNNGGGNGHGGGNGSGGGNGGGSSGGGSGGGHGNNGGGGNNGNGGSNNGGGSGNDGGNGNGGAGNGNGGGSINNGGPPPDNSSSSGGGHAPGPTTTRPTPTTGIGNSTMTAPTPSTTRSHLSTTLSGTSSVGPSEPSAQVPAVPAHKVNVAAIVGPTVSLSLLLLAGLAIFLARRRRNRHRVSLGSAPDVSILPELPPPRRPSAFAALATRLRGGGTPRGPIVSITPAMASHPADSRPLSMTSSLGTAAAFETRHPFAAPVYPSTSGLGGSSIAFGSQYVAHGHSGSFSGHSGGSPSLPGHPGLYGHRYGASMASASGSIVGSGVFSLASAHHGHTTGYTPGAELGNPFEPAPMRPYSVAGTDESGRSVSQLARRSEMFTVDPDAPPVPPKPSAERPASPLSPESPDSANPLFGQPETRLAYLTVREVEETPVVIQHARYGSLSSAVLMTTSTSPPPPSPQPQLQP